MENPLTTPPLAQPPERYILLPWGWASALKLPDHLRLTYELVVALALAHDGRSTQAITRRQLAAWRDVALRTLDDHLAALRARGLVRSAVAAQGRGLVLRPTSLPRPQAVIRSAVGEIGDPAPEAVIGDTCRRDGSSRPGAVISDHGYSTPISDHDYSTAARRSPRPRCRPVERARGRPAQAPARLGRGRATPPRDPPQGADPSLEEEADLISQDPDQLLSETEPPGYATRGAPAQDERDPEAIALAVERLEAVGVYPGLSQRIAQLAWVTPELIEAWIARLARQRQVRHLGALLVALLRDPTRCLPAPPTAAPLDAAEGDAPDQDDGWEPEEDEDEPPGGTAPPQPASLPFAWDDWLAALRARLGEDSVDAWLAKAYPLSWADGDLVVAVPSAMGVDWLTRRYGRELDLAARELAGRPVRVRLTVARAPRR